MPESSVIDEQVLRVAIEEYIALGPHTLRPADERLAVRLPAVDPATRLAALAVAREAVAVAEGLARDVVDRRRSESDAKAELAARVPWCRPTGTSLRVFIISGFT